MGCYNPKSQKNLSKLAKKGLKILHFWTPWAIWCRYAQMTWDSFTKFGIQVCKVQTLLPAKFWIPGWILTTIFFQKTLKKRLKNPKFGFFGHIGCFMTARIVKFGINKHGPHMNPHAKFQKLGLNSFGDIRFWIFSKFCKFGFWIFLKKNRKYNCQFCENVLAYSFKVYQSNSIVSGRYDNPKSQKKNFKVG